MCCLQACERELYLPSIFSWLTSALATLSRLLLSFNSGSAIFSFLHSEFPRMLLLPLLAPLLLSSPSYVHSCLDLLSASPCHTHTAHTHTPHPP